MESYRRCNVIERLLSVATSRSLHGSTVEKITQLCCRCTYVEGTTTLVTRCGILAWIRSSMELYSENTRQQRLLHFLAMRVSQTCDKSRVDEWTERGGSNIQDVMASLGIS